MGPIWLEIVADDTRTNIREGMSTNSDISFALCSSSSSFSIITNSNILGSIAISKMPNSNSAAIMSIHISIICLRPHTKSNIVALSSFSLGYDISLRINKA